MLTRRSLLFSAPLMLTFPPMERQVFDAINFQRVCKDAEPLTWYPPLCITAREHSRRMLDLHFFGHVDPERGDVGARLDLAGILWAHCGENIVREKDHQDPVALAVVEWMYSPGHRRNLLNPDFTHSGVGIATDTDGRFAITQQFLTPLPPGYRTAPRMAPRSSGPT